MSPFCRRRCYEIIRQSGKTPQKHTLLTRVIVRAMRSAPPGKNSRFWAKIEDSSMKSCSGGDNLK